MFLACCFAPLANRFNRPLALLLSYPDRLAPNLSGVNASDPQRRPRLARKPRLQPPLPLGTFTSRRIKAFNWTGNLPARLPQSPDLPSLPAAGFYL